jgi:hypothetical protein
MIVLGKEYTDSITGFKGVAMARTEFLTGCVHVLLQPKALKNGAIQAAEWFDEQRVDPKSKVKTGGPGEHPPARSHGPGD